jgi:hypothetical protein
MIFLPFMVMTEVIGVPFTFEELGADIIRYPHMLLIDNPLSGQLSTHYTFTDRNSSYQLRYSFFKQTEKDYQNIRLAFGAFIMTVVWNVAGYEESKIQNFRDIDVKHEFNGDFGSFVVIQNPKSDYGKGFKYIMLNFYNKINQGMVVQSFLFNDVSFYQNKNYIEIFNSFKFRD